MKLKLAAISYSYMYIVSSFTEPGDHKFAVSGIGPGIRVPHTAPLSGPTNTIGV